MPRHLELAGSHGGESYRRTRCSSDRSRVTRVCTSDSPPPRPRHCETAPRAPIFRAPTAPAATQPWTRWSTAAATATKRSPRDDQTCRPCALAKATLKHPCSSICTSSQPSLTTVDVSAAGQPLGARQNRGALRLMEPSLQCHQARGHASIEAPAATSS